VKINHQEKFRQNIFSSKYIKKIRPSKVVEKLHTEKIQVSKVVV